MSKNETPLMRQYNQIKQKYPDTILFFRLGDFFETFGDDAVITAKVCGITLTKRNHGAAGDLALAGFPHHQLDAYLPKMVRGGYRVAVCEQLEDPKLAKGIVRRGVVEVVTPGVAMYDKLLDTKSNNYIAAIYLKVEKNGFVTAGISLADISTGSFFVTETSQKNLFEILLTFSPSEIIISKEQKNIIEIDFDKLPTKPAITKMEDWIFEKSFSYDLLLKQFKTQNLKGFGIQEFDCGISSSGAILHYIGETQKAQLDQISSISRFDNSEFMTLDYSTRRNLEITFSNNDNQKSTLISILDKTQTAMGGRMLKKWISMPLKNLHQINERLEAVNYLFQNNDLRAYISKNLSEIGDLERLIAKVCANRANPRDCVALKQSLSKIPDIKSALENNNNQSISKFANKLEPLIDLINLIDVAIKDEPTSAMGSGNIFKNGYHAELDSYIHAKTNAKKWMEDYQENERLKSNIPTLKVNFNNVFGYYIEVTKVQASKVPDYYERKQTLTNAERYTTPEIKEMESKVFGAEEKILELETYLFNELRLKIAKYVEPIQRNAFYISSIDCLHSFAEVSSEYDYVLPQMDESEDLIIEEGRHPIVERLLHIGERFTPNSTNLDTEINQIQIITGPNMSGKSCYLRQTALIVLLAQIGCFVPAKSAKIGVVDRIFTRVGAQDNISAGESTFLVEMQEAANIMNSATNKSLILLDEVGRGTATFDGISIAWSIAEYLHNKIGAKTLFATHYHELNDLADRYEKIHNFKVEVLETGSNIVFTHKVVAGASDYSFGIHVAKMAGLPYDVIERANEIMTSLSNTDEESTDSVKASKSSKVDVKGIKTAKHRHDANQLAIFEIKDDSIRERLLSVKIENMTPIQALQVLSELQMEAKKS